MNVWDQTNNVDNDVKRSNFDWSHQVNGTYQFGYLYPIFSEYYPPNSSAEIQVTQGLQFMPMVFPVQTRMKARVSFFRVPLRTLWKDYKDFIGNFREGLEPPYMDFKNSFDDVIGVGKLADYLSIPVTQVGDYGVGTPIFFGAGSRMSPVYFQDLDGFSNLVKDSQIVDSFPVKAPSKGFYFGLIVDLPEEYSNLSEPVNAQILNIAPTSQTITVNTTGVQITDLFYNKRLVFAYNLVCLDSGNSVLSIDQIGSLVTSAELKPSDNQVSVELLSPPLEFSLPAGTSRIALVISMVCSAQLNAADYVKLSSWTTISSDPDSDYSLYFQASTGQNGGTVIPLTRQTSPYYDSSSPAATRQIKLNAYAFRAYESVYNAYFRDPRNNPFVLNGQVEYNKWIPSDEGGADLLSYKLRRVNWEKDFLTTAVSSPQQGKAPLVGLTTYVDQETVDGITSHHLRLALVDEDGKKFSVSVKENAAKTGLDSVEYQPLADNIAVNAGDARSIVDILSANTGISIPDLRIVNAYQKFLELNIRKGFSYKQIMEGRWDCNVKYDELMMPEFLGGITEPIQMNRVVQSVEIAGDGSYSGALGSQAGDAFVNGTSRKISFFTDEECIVIGVLSIVPIPNYSQLLPKHFLYRDLLDYPQPEFNHIGFQPITYAEVCPVQAFANGDSLQSVFGYQRPWYELCGKVDTVHGLFRTEMRNFLINRVFNKPPALNEDFLLVDPEQTNDVFSVTETTDKIFGQIWLDISSKLPISRIAIPRLD